VSISEKDATLDADTSVPDDGLQPGVGPVPPASAAAGRSIRIGGRSYPLILPKLRDPRLHVAAVVITIHTLGQVGLHFQVSVPQILSAVLTTAIIGVAVTFRATRSIVWPASAMLTGSGVALILRVPTTPPGEHWTFHKWYVFAGVAALCMLIKHMIRYRGGPLFNPSNAGLVVAFLVLGSTRVEPLDFWWSPLNGWLVLAYVAIVGGGLLITARLRLLALAATFWVALGIGLGLLANSGHSITARWAFTPVTGWDYWRVVMFSPELMIFVFFMITDPKTVPKGRVGRVLFGLMVAVTCVLLMAPQTTEFGTKIALLGGLVLVCAARPLIDRFVPVPGSEEDRLGRFAVAVTTGGNGRAGIVRGLARVTLIGAALAVVGVGVVAAGASAREVVGADADEVLGRVPHDVNPSTFPTITVDQGVLDWDHEISGEGAQQIVLTLAENLELETQALLRQDESILKAVDHGDRLDDMQGRLLDARTSGTTVVERYLIDDVHVTLLVPFGRQDGLSLGLESTGTMTTETYDDAGDLQSSESSPFASTFVLRRATGGRWLNVAQLPLD
jgi:hypothetical protein